MKQKKLALIWKLFHFTQVAFGYADIDGILYKIYRRSVFGLFMILHVIDCVVLAWTAATSDNLEIKFLQGMDCGICVPTLVLIPLTFSCFELCEDALEWCESLQERLGLEECFKTAHRRSTSCFKFFYYGVFGSACVGLVLQPLFSSLKTGHLESYFFTPPPFGTFGERLLICIIQYLTPTLIILSNCWAFSVTCTVFFHAIACYDHVIETSRALVPGMTMTAFNGVVQQMVELHCEAIETLESFLFYASGYLGIFEGTIYAALLIMWITVFFMRETAVFAVGVIPNVGPFFYIATLNEELSEAYDRIFETMYNLPWYEMTPKMRKYLQFIMAASERKKLLTCGPFHVVTYNQVLTIFQRVYSYGLALNEFLEV